jgi:hypothetical protein
MSVTDISSECWPYPCKFWQFWLNLQIPLKESQVAVSYVSSMYREYIPVATRKVDVRKTWVDVQLGICVEVQLSDAHLEFLDLESPFKFACCCNYVHLPDVS